jgi:hypothetical protein
MIAPARHEETVDFCATLTDEVVSSLLDYSDTTGRPVDEIAEEALRAWLSERYWINGPPEEREDDEVR